MVNLDKLPLRTKDNAFHVVVESPRGSGVKLKYESTLGAFTISRPLVLGVVYPFDWGFIPSSRAADGDPLDAMVFWDTPTYPGVVIPCAALGVVKVSQKRKNKSGRERNDRVIAVPVSAPRLEGVRDARQLPEQVRKEIEQFFLTAVVFAAKDVELLGWDGPEVAEKLIDQAERAALSESQ